MELNITNLGDHRLDCRLIKLSKSLSGQPQAPINKACEDWKNTKAAYDFFDNEKVSPERILEPHQRSTVERMKEYRLVLKIQDTTYYNFTSHRETRGLGPIGTEDQNLRGLVGHCTLVVTPEGLPLGILAHKIWARDDETQGCAKNRAKLPIEEKESYKWLESIQETRDLMPEGVEVVNVNDRESDIYEFFQQVGKTGEKLLVRSLQNRCLIEEQKKLWDFISSQPVEGLLEVSVPPKDKQPARTATVEIRFGSVTLKPPQRLKTQITEELKPIEIDGVRVKEINAPEGAEPLDWKLLTTVPVKTFNDAVERVSWYRARWNIETYFKVLKSGCKVEDCRLETAKRLIRFITLKSVIAWRLFWMTKINRINPDAACTLVLADQEWKALYTIIHGKVKLPTRLPTVRQVVRWIAQLGGFLGRKCDKEPGITVIWRGWHRLNDFVAMYLVLM
ncbi:MAG: IS4 family transposase [Planctomycetes bacterium]|nr:IS4 family transposase [Planctomycetota bacterium]